MKVIGWIRYGDKASCGGIVVEASEIETSHGRGYTFQGARISCKRGCVIADGYERSTLSGGRRRVLHGMLTSGGCPLESTLNDIDGASNASGETIASTFYQTPEGNWLPKFGPEHFTEDSPDEQVQAIDANTGEPIADLAYYIQAPDGSTYSGYTDQSGLCERVTTFHIEELAVWFGEDAMQKRQDT